MKCQLGKCRHKNIRSSTYDDYRHANYTHFLSELVLYTLTSYHFLGYFLSEV
jgi:hypothetical protein